jgi:DNA-binding transcriptional MerR regulator
VTDDYPLSPKYTKAQIDRVDRLYDQHPIETTAEMTGIPAATITWWHKQGYISTDVCHRSRSNRKYSDEVVERADALWDRMPLSGVSDILGVPYETLRNWAKAGRISTDVNHKSNGGKENRNRRRAHRAAYLVHEQGYLQKEAAEKMGVSQGSISRYLKMYRTGTFVHPESA